MIFSSLLFYILNQRILICRKKKLFKNPILLFGQIFTQTQQHLSIFSTQWPQVYRPLWATLPSLSFYVTHSPSWLPFRCFPPRSSIHLALPSCLMSCHFPVTSLSPSLSIWLRDILLPNTRLILYAHKLKPTIPNVCTHTELLIDVHTYCIQKQRTNGAEMPNMIQHDRGGQQHQQRKLWLVYFSFHFHLKVTVFLRCWEITIPIKRGKENETCEEVRISAFSIITLWADKALQGFGFFANTLPSYWRHSSSSNPLENQCFNTKMRKNWTRIFVFKFLVVTFTTQVCITMRN